MIKIGIPHKCLWNWFHTGFPECSHISEMQPYEINKLNNNNYSFLTFFQDHRDTSQSLGLPSTSIMSIHYSVWCEWSSVLIPSGTHTHSLVVLLLLWQVPQYKSSATWKSFFPGLSVHLTLLPLHNFFKKHSQGWQDEMIIQRKLWWIVYFLFSLFSVWPFGLLSG